VEEINLDLLFADNDGSGRCLDHLTLLFG